MNAVVKFEAPRLPYHEVVSERFGVDKSGWKVLCEAVFPAAEKPDSIIMALAYCKARNLDVFKKPVQIVPIYDKKRGGMVDTVWPGISELRTTAMRTGSFAGFDETQFGPMIEAELGGLVMHYPEWAQCTVYRMLNGQRVPFIGPKTYWIETYATAKRDTTAPNAMWKKRPRGQLEKCAEAAALRRAFPEELGNEYAAEEVAGQSFSGRDAAPVLSGVMDRLPGASTGAGFAPTNMDQLEHPAAPEDIDAILDGDFIPDHDAVTGEITETTTSDGGAPSAAVEGEREGAEASGPSVDGPSARTPSDEFPGDQPVTTGPTLAERVQAFKDRASAAPNSVKLKAIGNAAGPLRTELDAKDPDMLADLDQWFKDRVEAVENAEREAAGR